MNVFEQDRSYRRGLVLGLTMAEIVTLVIFCLLLAFGVVLQERQAQIADLHKQLDAVSKNRELASQLLRHLQQRFPKAATLEDFKRMLAKQEQIAEAVEQRVEGVDLSHLAEDARLGAQVRQAAAANKTTPRDIVEQGAKKAGEDPGNKWPPFFKLSEADGYYFKTGSAMPASKLQEDLKGSIADKLDAEIRKWKIDVVEVVGHTDEQPLRGETNLDLQLIPVLNSAAAASNEALRFGDNAGLGMARAAEIVRILRQDPRFQKVSVLPLSAAQSIFPVDMLATGANSGNVKERRRIEIRLRRFSQEMPSN